MMMMILLRCARISIDARPSDKAEARMSQERCRRVRAPPGPGASTLRLPSLPTSLAGKWRKRVYVLKEFKSKERLSIVPSPPRP